MAIISARKWMHWLLGGFLCLAISYYVAFPTRFYLAAGGFVLMSLVEIFRFKRRERRWIFVHLVTFGLMRRAEWKNMTGAFWMTLGLLFLSIFPNRTILCLSVISMGFADPVAEIIGRRWPVHRYPNKKSLGGGLGFFMISLIACLLFLKYVVPTPHASLIALSGSLVAATLESASDRFDNLVVLLGTAGWYYSLFALLGLT